MAAVEVVEGRVAALEDQLVGLGKAEELLNSLADRGPEEDGTQPDASEMI